jgi:hypothetical protein
MMLCASASIDCVSFPSIQFGYKKFVGPSVLLDAGNGNFACVYKRANLDVGGGNPSVTFLEIVSMPMRNNPNSFNTAMVGNFVNPSMYKGIFF